MAIIFNVLPPDEATVNASRIPDGSFFRPVGHTSFLYLKLGPPDTEGDIPVMTFYPGKCCGASEFVQKTDDFVLVEDITMSFPAFVVKEKHA
jgi:hypothetical protein